MNRLAKWALALSAGLSFSVTADVLALKEGHPTTYVVKKGDTLWDISDHFLNTPWLWPKLWQANPQVENPHLIYPGDRLYLIYVDGEPRLSRKRMVQLSPEARIKSKGSPIPTISMELIGPFLSRDFIGSDEELAQAPRLLGNNDGVKSFSAGHSVYARGGLTEPLYGIYRPKRDLYDPISKEFLGQEIEFLGSAQLEYSGDEQNPAKLNLKQSYRDSRIGDLLLPLPDPEDLPAYFSPRSGSLGEREGRIIASRNELRATGKYDVVILNLGSRDDVEAGDMFNVQVRGMTVERHKDEYHYDNRGTAYQRTFKASETYQLPDETIGQLMVFRAYEKTSLALITKSRSTVRIDDKLAEID